jgi:hypothetical protein
MFYGGVCLGRLQVFGRDRQCTHIANRCVVRVCFTKGCAWVSCRYAEGAGDVGMSATLPGDPSVFVPEGFSMDASAVLGKPGKSEFKIQFLPPCLVRNWIPNSMVRDSDVPSPASCCAMLVKNSLNVLGGCLTCEMDRTVYR